jgi:fatty-acyl-CoA synthase
MHCLERSPGHDISSLRLVACGGSAVPLSLMRTFQERHGVYIQQAWGMTETSPLATVAKPLPGVSEERHWQMRATQGRPMCGVEVRIVDDEGNRLPDDGKAVGELEVRGPWITGGYYLGRDAEKFDSGWLRTGDVGVIDPDGYVTLTDRAKDVIKSGGEWISSVELENHLIAHPAVLEAAVVGVPDDRWGEVGCAYIVVQDGMSLEAEQVILGCARYLAPYKKPKHVRFIEAIPRNAAGKAQKHVLRAKNL